MGVALSLCWGYSQRIINLTKRANSNLWKIFMSLDIEVVNEFSIKVFFLFFFSLLLFCTFFLFLFFFSFFFFFFFGVELGVIVMKKYFALPRSAKVEPHHPMQTCVILCTHLLLTLCRRYNQGILNPADRVGWFFKASPLQLEYWRSRIFLT